MVETVYSDQVDDMKEAMKEVLDKYPALDGVFCTNAEVSEMFLEVNKDTGENKVAMVGVDATSKQQEAIQKGKNWECFPRILMRWDIRPCGRLFSLLHRRRKQRLIRRFYLIRYGSMLRISKAKTLQIICIINR